MKKSYALVISLVLCSVSLTLLLLFGDFYLLTLAFFLTGGSYMIWSLMSAIIGPTAPESSRARWLAVPQTISMFVSVLARAKRLQQKLMQTWEGSKAALYIFITLLKRCKKTPNRTKTQTNKTKRNK